MRFYSKLLTLVVFTTLGTLLSSCNNDEGSAPNTLTCNLASATIVDSEGFYSAAFNYNNQRQITGFNDSEGNVVLNYQPDKVFANIDSGAFIDTMFLQNGQWSKSVSRYPFESSNRPGTLYNRIITTPVIADGLITQLNVLTIEETEENGQIATRDSSLATYNLTYNASGNVTSIRNAANQEGGNIDFVYADSTKNIKSNSYFNFIFLAEYFLEDNLVAVLTGKINLFRNPPSRITNVDFPSDRITFTGIKADVNNNLKEINGTRAENPGPPSERFSFTYDCK